MPNQQVETLRGRTILAASSHHGILPTGGVAREKQSFLVSTGSCWIASDAQSLAKPSELLAAFNSKPNSDRPGLHGTFALAFVDETKQELTAESDCWSAYPLYYRRMGSGIAISTAIKFLVSPGEEKINHSAVMDFLAVGYLPGFSTLIEGIFRVPGNSRLVFGRDGVRTTSFPFPKYTRQRVLDDEAVDEYDSLVRRYLGRYSNFSSSYCISMSGGLDSRLLGAAGLREGFPLSAFTIGEKGSLDARMAGKVCRLLDIPLATHEVDGSTFSQWFGKTVWFTEGRVLPEHLHYMTAHFSRAVPQGPQLHGLMGEIVLGGHFDNASLQNAGTETIRKACVDMVSPVIYWPPGSLASTVAEGMLKESAQMKSRIAEGLFPIIDFKGSYSDYLNFKYFLKAQFYMNPCIMSQVVTWSDVVNPFSDNEAFDLGASLSLDGIAERGGQIKWGLRHLPVIGKLPRVKAGVLIDVMDSDPDAYRRGAEKLMKQEKFRYSVCRLSRGRINLSQRRSFPEYGSWYRKWAGVRDYVDGILLDDQTFDRGILQRQGIQKLLTDLRLGKNVWGAVGTCLLIEIFLRQFVDGTDWPQDPVLPLGMEP